MARLFNVTINARDPITLGRFWSAALGLPTVGEEPDLVRLAGRGHGPDLLLLRAEVSSSASTLHLDLAAHNPRAEVERLRELGAGLVDVGEGGEPTVRTANGIDWYVLTDPEGNEFCVGGEP